MDNTLIRRYIFMYDYNIWPENSPKKFKYVCKIIEKEFPGIEKENLLINVDGSTIQTYIQHGKIINVFDDYDIGAVFVESEIDLKFIFESMKQSEHSIEC